MVRVVSDVRIDFIFLSIDRQLVEYIWSSYQLCHASGQLYLQCEWTVVISSVKTLAIELDFIVNVFRKAYKLQMLRGTAYIEIHGSMNISSG